jgi:hypothetical protein
MWQPAKRSSNLIGKHCDHRNGHPQELTHRPSPGPLIKTELVRRLRNLHRTRLDDIRARKDDIPADSLALTFGILTDKLATMEGMPTQIHATVNVAVNGMSREELTNVLSGKRQPRNATPEA